MQVPSPVSPAQLRAQDFSSATSLEGWICKSLEEVKHEPTHYNNLGENATITIEDVRWALRVSSKGKAPGLTGLTNDILFHASDYAIIPLANFMTTVLQTGIIPQDCLNALVLSIPKTDAPTNILETRPIALTECILKLLTKIITARISAVWQEHGTITQHQYASLPGMGVDTPLQITRCIFEEAAEERRTLGKKHARHLHVLYVDYSKAFDSCETWLLESAMRRMGVPETTIALFADLDSNTQNALKTEGGKTASFHPERGAWQGETCSPLRFVAILQILLDQLAKTKKGWRMSTGDTIFGHAYMDDCFLVAEDNESLQELADILSQFCAAIGLKLNAGKSFYSTTDPNPNHSISIYDPATNTSKHTQKVPPTAPIRYLGVHFTLDLNWKTQKTLVDQKIKKICDGIRRSPLSYTQSVVAANLLAGGLANFHFLIVDFS